MKIYSRAVLSYGLFLDEEAIIKLLKALGFDEGRIDHAIMDGEFVEIIKLWIDRQETEPFRFSVERGDWGVKLAILYVCSRPAIEICGGGEGLFPVFSDNIVVDPFP